MNKKSENSILLFFTGLMLLSSCAPIFSGRKNVTFSHNNKDTEISLSGGYSKKNEKENTYNLSNRTDYLVTQKKAGYKTITTPISPSKLNPLIIVDFAIPTFFIGGALLGIEIFYAPATFTTLSSLAPLTYGPWKVHNSNYNLPTLKPFPTRQGNERHILAGKVNLDISSNKISTYYRNSSDISTYTKTASSLKTENLQRVPILEKNLTDKLKEFGYLDTVNMFTHLINPYKVNLDLYSVSENIWKNFYSMGITAKWTLINGFTDKAITTVENTAYSNWTNLVEVSDKFRFEHLSDAIELSLIDLLQNGGITKSIEIEETKFQETYANWNTIKIKKNEQNTIPQLANAGNSSVTIISKTGHGSGFFISNDGYIITCYHVVGDNSKDIEVLTNNGIKHKCEIIRSNPNFDLTLIKIDTQDSAPVKFCKDLSLSAGMDVYAIGTPKDINLAQTITKGIISGIRTSNNRSFIQSDVSINSGNSGGALLNSNGELLGIVNAKLYGVSIEGIGFAIPNYYIKEALKISFE